MSVSQCNKNTKNPTPDDKYPNIDITFHAIAREKKNRIEVDFNCVLAFSTFSVDNFAFVVTSVKFNI